MNMTIIHGNNTHSHLAETSTSLMLNGEKTYLSLGGVARMASKIVEIKEYKPDSLELHAGDAKTILINVFLGGDGMVTAVNVYYGL